MTISVLLFQKNDPYSAAKRRAAARGESVIWEAKNSLVLTMHLIMNALPADSRCTSLPPPPPSPWRQITSNHVVCETPSGVNQSPRTWVAFGRELMAAYLATKHFQHILEGRPFSLLLTTSHICFKFVFAKYVST